MMTPLWESCLMCLVETDKYNKCQAKVKVSKADIKVALQGESLFAASTSSIVVQHHRYLRCHTHLTAMLLHSLLLLYILGTVGADATAVPKEAESCPSPFVQVGSRCVHLDFTVSGTWEEMRQFCQELGSDLAVLSDGQFYVDSQQYIRSLGSETPSIWVGATDVQTEGLWLWIDGTPVVMGTPYWAYMGSYNIQQPNGGEDQNCAVLVADYYHYMNDFPCDSSYYPFCVI